MRRKIATLHLPLSIDETVAITDAIVKLFPNAVAGADPSGDMTVWDGPAPGGGDET